MKRGFVVPFAESAEEAERVYNLYVKISDRPLAHPTARLRRINFRRYKNGYYTAEVDKEISLLAEPVGRVFAIIEFNDVIQVYSTLRAWTHPFLVKPHEVIERVYFDDYPAEQTNSVNIL